MGDLVKKVSIFSDEPFEGAYSVECPTCAAPPGRKCRIPSGKVIPIPHQARQDAEAKAARKGK